MQKMRVCFVALLLAITIALPGVSGLHVAAADTGVTLINGSYKITNPTYVESGAEVIFFLADVGSEVKHSADVESDPNGIIIADSNGTTAGGKYRIELPIHPRGPLFKLDTAAQDKQGVGIYVIAQYDSFNGGDISQHVQLPQNNGSTRYDDARQRISGGKLFVWSPDGGEKFPTAFGADGMLFTADDPLGDIQPGWSMIDLDQKTFKIVRSDTVTADYIESSGALEDYSKLSYADAWTKLFTRVSTHYPFTELKKLNWKTIHDKIQPMIDAASTDDDFIAAIQAFTLSIPDTHVGTSQISNASKIALSGEIGVRDLVLTDDGKVFVKSVTPNGPADKAGMKSGAIISQVDGKPVLDVVDATSTVFSGASTSWFKHYIQLPFFLRGKASSTVKLTFQNVGEDAKTISIRRREGFDDFSPVSPADPLSLVVSAKVLPSGIGYISITNFYQDRALEYRLFKRDLAAMIAAGVKGLIIDDRDNAGGFSDMGTLLAGHFYKEHTLVYSSYSIDEKGVFQKRDSSYIDPQTPNFDLPVAVLINANTVSEGDFFAYFMKRAPNVTIVGSTPSSGAGGGIGQYKLPAGIEHWQAPEIRPVDADGKIIIEGEGVPPDVKVPVTVESLRSGEDTVLKAAEAKLLGK